MHIHFWTATHFGVLAIGRDLRKLCVVVACSALLANFLPSMAWFKNKLRHNKNVELYCYIYSWFIDIVATIALNLRICLPSLDHEIMGFRRIFRHRIRNFRQERADRRYNAAIHQRGTTTRLPR